MLGRHRDLKEPWSGTIVANSNTLSPVLLSNSLREEVMLWAKGGVTRKQDLARSCFTDHPRTQDSKNLPGRRPASGYIGNVMEV